ncbi:MAG: C-terminal helicase domain-containing protein, partial [bacterium]
IFRQAQGIFNQWSKLPAQQRTASAILERLHFDFFELLDSVTIARSRKHIERFYDAREFGTFPTRLKPHSYRCPITMRDDVIGFNDIYLKLSELKLSIYAPVSYILPSRIRKYEELYDTDVERCGGKLRQIDRERSLQNLMTVNLLKRLESSVEAFRRTLTRLQVFNSEMLEKIDRYKNNGTSSSINDLTDSLKNLEADEDDLSDFESNKTGGKVQVDFEDMDLDSWEYDLSKDLEVIDFLLDEMNKVTPEHDAKLNHIKSQIEKKISSPINGDNKKVLIFSAFADTTNYLYDNLAGYFKNTHDMHTGKVTGKDTPKTTLGTGYDFQTILTFFSPKSKEKDLIFPDKQGVIDILIGTDCISEGQNLQDCDCVFNYDIHWNPVRIIQRFGRIDRIGSTNEVIQLVNYWPDISLDEYINLKERVENRMVIADVTATGDDNVLSNQSQDIAYRKEQLRRLQEEVIDLEDMKTGVNITDLGLNDFRMDLVNYVKKNEDLAGMPNGLHALVPANPEIGLVPGVIFTLRNRNSDVNINQHNRLHPYYLVYVTDMGEVVIDHTQIKKLLDLVRSSCNGISEPILELCRRFNTETKDGREMSRYSGLLSKTITSIIDVKEDKDIDSLFTGRKTTALVDTISGLDDFELIDFLVIQEQKT